jgi:hypothetical protein
MKLVESNDAGDVMNPDNMSMVDILHNIYELCKTPEGKQTVKNAITAAKISFGVHQILDYLDSELKVFSRSLDYEEVQNICNIMLYACCQATYKEIMAFIDSIPPDLLDTVDDTIGNC